VSIEHSITYLQSSKVKYAQQIIKPTAAKDPKPKTKKNKKKQKTIFQQ